MIGLPSLLIRAAAALIAGAAGCIPIYKVWRERRVYVRILLAIPFLLVSLALIAQIAYNREYLLELRCMDYQKIKAVMVGDETISDPTALQEIAGCLQSSAWFDGKHGGEGSFFVILHRDGARRVWRINRIRGGAVIDFGMRNGESGLYCGAAFSECLPAVLRRHGVLLP